jgi:hypothetical protein
MIFSAVPGNWPIAYYADNDSCFGCRGQVYTVTNATGHVDLPPDLVRF